jgi:hypothetical protein
MRQLSLDAHITLAFATGLVLDIKADRDVEIEQRAIHRNVWNSNDTPRDPSWPGRHFDQRHKPHRSRRLRVQARVLLAARQISKEVLE